jgi:hypothetical protein
MVEDNFPDKWDHQLGNGMSANLIIHDLNEWLANGMKPDGREVSSRYSIEAWGTTKDPR